MILNSSWPWRLFQGPWVYNEECNWCALHARVMIALRYPWPHRCCRQSLDLKESDDASCIITHAYEPKTCLLHPKLAACILRPNRSKSEFAEYCRESMIDSLIIPRLASKSLAAAGLQVHTDTLIKSIPKVWEKRWHHACLQAVQWMRQSNCQPVFSQTKSILSRAAGDFEKKQ